MDAFQRFVAGIDYPLYVVTTAVQQQPTGCLVGFATQCSIHPPRFLVCISKKNHTFPLAGHAAMLAVHVVAQDNKPLAELFGGETGDDVDKFSRVSWRLVDGVPVLDACARWFTGSVVQQIDVGDHVAHLLDPMTISAGAEGDQLSFQQARDIQAGHKP
jgi:flavin reductase (DIM6/NTAB) family NADH-FMN oxidoreductase RutF